MTSKVTPFKALSSLLLFASFGSSAADRINNVSINGNNLLFSTVATKTHSLPSCIDTGQEQLWSASLKSNEGQSIYSMLITAISTEKNITVESADDCNAAQGIERAKAISIVN